MEAGGHYEECGLSRAGRICMVYPYVSEIYESILFLEYDSNVADILSGRPERVSAKKGPPPGHSALRFDGPPLTE